MAITIEANPAALLTSALQLPLTCLTLKLCGLDSLESGSQWNYIMVVIISF
jgi:hypothetical protein